MRIPSKFCWTYGRARQNRPLSQGLKEECTEAVAYGVAEGCDPHRVVTAREREALKRDTVAADRGEEFVGQFVGESGVVAPADRQNLFARAVQARDVRIRTNGRKIAADFVERNFVVQRLPYVRSCESGSNHITKICGDMQERAGAQSRFMRDGEKREAGADTGAENAEAVVALLFEPAQGASRIEHRLAIGLQGEADVGAHHIIRSRMAGNGAAIVIGQAQFHGGDAELIQPPADVLLLLPTRIPLRENDYGRTAAARVKQLRVQAIILRPRRGDGAGEREDVVSERVVVRRGGGEPFVAACDRGAREIFQPTTRVAFVR